MVLGILIIVPRATCNLPALMKYIMQLSVGKEEG